MYTCTYTHPEIVTECMIGRNHNKELVRNTLFSQAFLLMDASFLGCKIKVMLNFGLPTIHMAGFRCYIRCAGMT